MTEKDYIEEAKLKAFESIIPPKYRSAEISDFSTGIQKKMNQLVEGGNAIVFGINGVGKTRMAWAVAKGIKRRGKEVRYVKAQTLLFDIKRQDDPYRYCEKEFGRCDCLIVDEIDKIFDSKADFIYLNYLIDYRSEWERQNIVLGNGDRQTFLASLGQSIFSRLRGDGGQEITLTGKDRRMG